MGKVSPQRHGGTKEYKEKKYLTRIPEAQVDTDLNRFFWKINAENIGSREGAKAQSKDINEIPKYSENFDANK